MKTREEILEEIRHQENQYNDHKEKANAATSETGQRSHLEICMRHAARRQALLWVLSEDDTDCEH